MRIENPSECMFLQRCTQETLYMAAASELVCLASVRAILPTRAV